MKRADLAVGMTVETKNGAPYVIISTDGWTKSNRFYAKPTGEVIDGHPVVVAGDRGDAPGVLAVRKSALSRRANGEPWTPEGEPVTGEILQSRLLFPDGHYHAAIKTRQVEMEAQVAADEHRDRELVEMVNRYWSDVPHLISTAGVTLDGGLLTERERQTLVTLILAGQNR